MVYQLDYNKEGLEHKDEYLKMFDDCGWEYLQEYAGYSYFRKAVAEDGVVSNSICYVLCEVQSIYKQFQEVT